MLEINSLRRTEKIIGISYLLSTASFMIGAVLLDPVRTGPDYLDSIFATHKIRTIAGVFLQFINDVAIVVIAVMMVRILKVFNENIAFGILAARIVESVVLIMGGIGLLLLLPLSHDFINPATAKSGHHQTLGLLLNRWYNQSFNIAMLCLGIGGFLLGSLLYRRRLVPRTISLMGAIGYPLLFIKSSLDIFGYSSNIGNALFLPAGLFELILPIWLLWKGFNRDVLKPVSG